MVNNVVSMKEMHRWQNSLLIFHKVSPASLLDASPGNCQRALVDKSGVIRNRIGTHNRPEMVAVRGSPCAPTPQGQRIKRVTFQVTLKF
jgi:hypothetical protein